MPVRVYYDGGCGLCHRTVLFLLRRDPDGSRFRFAPTQEQASGSVVVELPDGQRLTHSGAVFHLLQMLDGGWGLLGRCGATLPRSLTDLGYRIVARIRRGLFPAPDGLCPRVPIEWRERFELERDKMEG